MVVLFGGTHGGQVVGDTWVYYSNTNTWEEITCPEDCEQPLARHDPAMAWIESGFIPSHFGITVVLFGGFSGSSVLDDTWIFSDNNTWSQVGNLETAPSARTRHAMAHVGSPNNVLLFGGSDQNNSALGDTWIFNVNYGESGNTWTEITPSNATPTPRFGHGMAFLGTNEGQALLVGG